jgi:hypothetical protein
VAATTWDTVHCTVSVAPITGLVTETLPLSDPNVVGWRIFYGDGTTADSHSTTWALAPATNVQAVMVYLGHNWDPVNAKPYRLCAMGDDVYQDDGGVPVQKTGTLLAQAAFDSIVVTAFGSELTPAAAAV